MPGHRLGGVEPTLQWAAVPVGLQGSEGEVDVAVEPVDLLDTVFALVGRVRPRAWLGHRSPGPAPGGGACATESGRERVAGSPLPGAGQGGR